jgi:hypothetical protein
VLNSGLARMSIGAVQVLTGNMQYFETASQLIGPEHVMASGALPPGFPPIEIDGEPYWDGGLVSNTPLEHVLERTVRRCAPNDGQLGRGSSRRQYQREVRGLEENFCQRSPVQRLGRSLWDAVE